MSSVPTCACGYRLLSGAVAVGHREQRQRWSHVRYSRTFIGTEQAVSKTASAVPVLAGAGEPQYFLRIFLMAPAAPCSGHMGC